MYNIFPFFSTVTYHITPGVTTAWNYRHFTNMPCQCGYHDGMSPRGKMV